MNAIGPQLLSDPDAPYGRHASFPLPPLETRGLARTERGGCRVHGVPCDRIVGHGAIIGQIVYSVKDDLPKDLEQSCRHNLSMPKDTTPSDYLNDFLGRVKAARESMGWTLKQMAKALDIPEARYAKYETRTPLPHDLIERFALITGLSVEYLITGESSKRPKPPKPSKPERERA